MKTIAELSEDLATGRQTARTLLEDGLARAEDPAGEGARVFIQLQAEKARAQAGAADRRRAAGAPLSPVDGIPITIKDLFDVEGEVSGAGARIFAQNAPAAADCPAVARLRAAGLVFVGRTNMTEFAYSGLGLNPHFGTPRNPFDRETGRVPGGSSSGAAVSVADGMAAAGMGTDTGGSCRIPAALCGITGYKPTAKRVPIDGVTPLSFSLDSVGPLARTVDCCRTLDGILAATTHEAAPIAAGGLKVGIIANYVTEDWDDAVAAAFAEATRRLGAAGVSFADLALPELDRLPEINGKGGLAAAEAYHYHREHLARAGDGYDPRVASRIAKGAEQTAADYIDLLRERRAMIEAVAARAKDFDVLACPTVPIIAPAIDALEDDDDYGRVNLLMLRNPTVGNYLDLCAISLPIHAPGTAPVGLMLFGKHGDDTRLFQVAAAVEAALA